MTDPDLNNKLDRLLTLLEAQLELTRQGHREERLQRAQLSREETMDLSHSEDQAGGGDESMIGDPHTPTPAPRSRRSVSFNLDEQEDINYEKYASPTGPRYVKTKLDPYSRTRTDPYPLDHEEDTSIMAELNRSKPIATPFPKFNPRDMEIFILEAEAWFKFNQVYEQSRMINHMGAQLEGTAREWWTSKLRIDRAREGRLFNDWHYFTERLSEQFNPRNARMEAYNKLLALRLTSDAPGAATRHGIGHWARDCPSRRVNPLSSRPMGPKVMVTTADPFEEATDSGDGHTGSTETGDPEAMDLSSYQQPMDPDHEEEHNDDDDKGNVSKAVLELSGMVQDHPARILADTGAGFSASMQVSIGTHNLATETQTHHTMGYGPAGVQDSGAGPTPRRPPEAARAAGDLTMRRPTLHGNEFVSAERILRAALEDGPIGFMLLEEPPSSLPAFGFVPTGADKGVEMEVEVDKVVTAADIPKPYQHLRDVFDEVEADKLPHHTEHDLHLELIEGGKPPQGPLYLKGPKEMSELRRYLDENLEKGFIRPSKSPARSPVLFVPKKDGGLRLCVDYRGLNEITVKNRAPLPLIEEQLFLLRKARIYTKLDLRAAYNLIRIAKGDEWKTAFGTQLGLYEYLVMPFGLANAPAHFQSFINDIFRDIIGVYVVVYLDDFLIFSDTEEVHVKHVTEVLTRLRNNRLFAKLSKCEFHTKTVEFLGYIIKPTGIEMDPEKVRTVKEWPMPESIHDIQRFLGFANFYRRFIAHFARIAKPLTALVKPIERFKKFELPEEAQQAFHKLIQAFTSAGVLQHFDYHLPTRLETDASDFAIAGVLKQEHEGRWHPVAFYSRKMSSAEKNYEIHDKELLAVYRPGDKGGEPDALTRRTDMQPAGEEQDHNVRQLLPPRVFKETADHDSLLVAPMISMESIASKGLKDLVKIFQPLDQELQEIHRKKPFELKDDLWYSGGRLVIPKPLATPDRPWGSISLDFIEGLPPSKKYDSKTYDSILVIVDRLTKFAILAPTHKTVTAKQTAVLLYGHMVRLFGYPDHMVSDRGRQFISGAWKAFAEQMGVKHSLSTAYHPQTDGQTERVNQVIEQYLRMYCNYEQNDWANLLDTAAFVYNNTVHNSIGVSPFFACYGWNPKAHPDIPQRLGVNDPGRFEYLMDGKERCKYLQEQIREAQRRSVNQYNRKHKDIEFKVGDMVYINRRNWKTRRPTPKLDTRFAGPYPVQERVGRRAYRITLPTNLRVHDVFHVSMLEPARISSLPQRAEQPTIPSLPDEDLDFEVEALIDKHSHNGITEYKVLWRGYSEEAASWEPVENLNCPDLIQEYEVSEGGRCHGPGCSRSRRVTGSYGRSTGIEDLVDTSREHGRSTVSMETMDSYGLTCKGGPSTATRRTKLKEQAQPRRGPSSRSMQMVTTQGLERQEPKELSLIKGGGAVSKESTPGHEEEELCHTV
ncbi:hypothetical protein NDA17_005982 [Ustilago hordei]|nr:hypothetical protein NDA17_005982 [Ustilago hordei]